MPEHESAPSPSHAGLDGRSSGLRVLLQLAQTLLGGICCFFTPSLLPRETCLSFHHLPQEPSAVLGAKVPGMLGEGVVTLGKLSGLLRSNTPLSS